MSDPNTQTIHAVDLESGEVWNSVDLPVAGNELALVSGDVETGQAGEVQHEGHEHEGDGHEGHEHEDHAHDD